MEKKRGDEYVEKLGLKNGHNAVQTIAAPFIEVSGDEEIVNFALGNATKYTKHYGKKYRIMVFVLKRDDTGYVIFNDEGGFNVGGPVVLSELQDFAALNLDLADYILFAEIGNNLYTVVTID